MSDKSPVNPGAFYLHQVNCKREDQVIFQAACSASSGFILATLIIAHDIATRAIANVSSRLPDILKATSIFVVDTKSISIHCQTKMSSLAGHQFPSFRERFCSRTACAMGSGDK
jgi:hypothetical protein